MNKSKLNFNAQGSIVQQLAIASEEYTLSLPVQHLPNGVYFLALMADGVRLANTK